MKLWVFFLRPKLVADFWEKTCFVKKCDPNPCCKQFLINMNPFPLCLAHFKKMLKTREMLIVLLMLIIFLQKLAKQEKCHSCWSSGDFLSSPLHTSQEPNNENLGTFRGFRYIYIYGHNLNQWAKRGQIFNFPQFQCFVVFLIFAFSCLSFSFSLCFLTF